MEMTSSTMAMREPLMRLISSSSKQRICSLVVVMEFTLVTMGFFI